jgi:hypothetical protein
MTYYPGEKWIDMLFSMGGYNNFLEGKIDPLDKNGSYELLLKLAKENLGGRPITQVSFGPDYDEYILELAKQHGIFFLTDRSYGNDHEDLADHLIAIPVFMEHNSQTGRLEPQDVWLIDLDNNSYDGTPYSGYYDGSVYDFYQLDKRFISKVDRWLQEYYGEEIGYDAINKRKVL